MNNMHIKITDTAYGGFGVGKDKVGKVIFVPYSVEGDTLDVSITKESKSFAYAKINDIIEASRYRIAPKCHYSNKCGGCLFAHIDYKKQIKIKENILKNSIRKCYTEDVEIVESKTERYRLRASLIALNGEVGFYGFKSRNFINIEDCIVMKLELFNKIKSFASTNNITGEIYAIETDKNIALGNIKNDKKILKKDEKILDGFTFNGKKYGIDDSAYGTIFGDIGVGHMTFFQANIFLLNEFQKKSAEISETKFDITELYAGSGFFTSSLRNKSYDMKSFEIDDKSVKLAKKYGYSVYKSEAANALEKITYTDTLFLDPPREGLTNNVIKNILRILPKKIIYVSCNPMTFSRDIFNIKDRYILEKIILLDMFPNTYHIETIALLNKI